jgi:hypothetical protein
LRRTTSFAAAALATAAIALATAAIALTTAIALATAALALAAAASVSTWVRSLCSNMANPWPPRRCRRASREQWRLLFA